MSSNGMKLSIEDMRECAARKSGACLSMSYANNKTKLLWQCARGHEWWARPDLLRRTRRPTWCPHCARKYEKTREEIAMLGTRRGGTLLTEETRGMHGDVLWSCARGHAFKARPNNVKYGHWCPLCWKQRHGEVARANGRVGHARKRETLRRDQPRAGL